MEIKLPIEIKIGELTVKINLELNGDLQISGNTLTLNQETTKPIYLEQDNVNQSESKVDEMNKKSYEQTPSSNNNILFGDRNEQKKEYYATLGSAYTRKDMENALTDTIETYKFVNSLNIGGVPFKEDIEIYDFNIRAEHFSYIFPTLNFSNLLRMKKYDILIYKIPTDSSSEIDINEIIKSCCKLQSKIFLTIGKNIPIIIMGIDKKGRFDYIPAVIR